MIRVSKVRLSLPTGNVVEKPVVTCFKGGNNNYLVLDNESNGQMGYPIICISRFNNNVAEKITDQSEWASVKENLKTIIGGTALPYIAVPENISAQEDFYTQLTLPVASFDVLKSNYKPAVDEGANASVMTTPVVETAPVAAAPVASTPVAVESAPVMPVQPVGAPLNVEPAATIPEMSAPVITPLPVNPVMDAPAVTPLPSMDAAPAPVVNPLPAAPSAPVMPSVEPAAVNNLDVQALKDSFMKSCENMFDALIKKFENK